MEKAKISEIEFYSINNQVIITWKGKSHTWEKTPLPVIELLSDEFYKMPQKIINNIHKNYGAGLKALKEFARCKYTSHHYRCHRCSYDCPFCAASEQFSNKQRQILSHLKNGRTYKEIGEITKISQSAIRKHIHRIKLQLHVNTQAALAIYAYKNNIG